MIATVTGGITWAMPAPIRKPIATSSQIEVCTPSSRYPRKATEISAIPPAQVARTPKRSTTSRARGAKTSWAAASGSISTPACSAL